MLFVSVAAGVEPPHDLTYGQMVGTFRAGVAGHEIRVVVFPSTTDVSVALLLPEGPGAGAAEEAARAGAAAGAPVGALATTLMPAAGVRQPKGL